MLVAEWTAGEAIHDRHGNTLDAKGLRRLRERIRVLSGDTQGGASLEDLARGIARRFPDLPPLPRTTAPVEPLRLHFEELWARLQRGHCAVLDGNPVEVDDPKSPLRSMQSKDGYDHAVLVHAAKGEPAFVMDPLGRGRYQGAWVPKADPRQFASRFATSSGSPYCAVVKRGEQSRVERLWTNDEAEDAQPACGVRHDLGSDQGHSSEGPARRCQGTRGGAPMRRDA
jgi:hypothetical protein